MSADDKVDFLPNEDFLEKLFMDADIDGSGSIDFEGHPLLHSLSAARFSQTKSPLRSLLRS